MALKWLDNNCYNLESSLSVSDSILPISNANAGNLCLELGSDDHTYLTISGPSGTEVVRATCSNGTVLIQRGQGGTSPRSFSAGKCACFKVNKIIMDEYIQEALTGGCTPTVEIAEGSEDYLVVTEPEDGECNWIIGLDAEFIERLQECCFPDECAPCVLPNGTYENATITVVDGKVCGISNGTNIVYTGGSLCSCGNCTNTE